VHQAANIVEHLDQFQCVYVFSSFTWFTGSWKALSKAGIDVAKLGWFTLKGEKYQLTEKGWWGVNAIASHMMMVVMWKAIYMLAMAATGGADEEEPDEEGAFWNKFWREALFPRVDPHDPQSRLAIPSYVTELYKIMRHTGIVGHEAEYTKLVSGRFNSLLSRGLEAFYHNEDWRGVQVYNPKLPEHRQS